MQRATRFKAAAVGALAVVGTLAGTVVPATAQSAKPSKHVLLISIDGMHNYDLAQCAANGECPHLAALEGYGTVYTNAATSEPSDSAPGTMALLTGGDPKLTGVYYDD